MPDTQENLAEQVEQPKKKGRSKSLVGLLLFANLAAGGGGFIYWRHSVERQHQRVEQPKVKEILHLEGFVVNLADRENHAFLRVGIDIGTYETPKKGGGEGPNPIPLMRDSIISVVATYKSDELLTSEGKAKLKHDLVAALQQRVPEVRVGEVYFTEFLVQQ